MSSSSSSSSPATPKKKESGETQPTESLDDEPVKSHAEKRREKRKAELICQRKGQDDTPSTKKRKLAGGVVLTKSESSAARPKRQNSVWVGNLSFKTNAEALRGFFDGVGEITRIHMPMKAGGQTENMGFAYVDFASPDAKVIAIALSERELHGRNLLIKDGGDFSGRPTNENGEGDKAGDSKVLQPGLTRKAKQILRIQKQSPAPSLFLGNLGFETTEQSIRQLFEAHPPRKRGHGNVPTKADGGADDAQTNGGSNDIGIRKIRMGTFEDSGNCKGFAFVDFMSVEQATAALINPKNHKLNGRDLVVEYASPDAVRRGGGGGQRTSKHERMSKKHSEMHEGRRSRDESGEKPGSMTREEWTQDQMAAEKVPEKSIGGLLNTWPGSTWSNKKRADRGDRQDKTHRGRLRPGAALASAPRASAAIVPSQGQKIIF